MSFSLPRHAHHASTASINSNHYPAPSQPSINGLSSHLQPPPTPVSAAVTRILVLDGFPASLKTRDLQAAIAQLLPTAAASDTSFQFRIKWLTDTSALVVFADAQLAKKTYLAAQFKAPKELSNGGVKCKVRPYDKPDAAQIVSSVIQQHQQQQQQQQQAAATAPSTGAAVPRHGARASFGGHPRPASMYASSPAATASGRDAQNLAALGFGGGSALSTSIGGSSIASGGVQKHGRSSSVSTLAGPGAGRPVAGRPSFGSLMAAGGGQNRRDPVAGDSHHRASSISSTGTSGATGSASWGRNSNVGAFGSFGSDSATAKTGKDAPGGGHDRMGTFRFGATPSSSSSARAAQPTATQSGGRLSTHIEVDTPQATPVGPSVSSFSSNGNAFPSVSAEDATTPALDITVGQTYAEGGPGGVKPSISEGARRMVRAGITGNANGVTVTSNGNTLHSGIRRESMDAASAQRALEQVSRALQGLGVDASEAAKQH